MAISTTERADILELVALMFDAAPGAAILADLVTLYEGPAARSLSALAAILGNTGVFQALHPNFETAQDFADDFLGSLGLAGDESANDWVISQYNAGTPLAAIIHAAWDFLDDLPGTAAVPYLNAKAIMENKAEVSEYYSVVLGRSSSSIAVLQDVLADVNANPQSVDAAIAQLIEGPATGPVLTEGVDLLQVPGTTASTITGLVDGDADASTANGTFSAGDRITGNGNTRVSLTVLEGGEAGFVRLDRIKAVDIFAATDTGVSFNAAQWSLVDVVRLNGGVDGLAVRLDNLQAGVDLSVANVAGTLAADYDTDAGNLAVLLRNEQEGGSGGTAKVEANGVVDIDMAAGMTAQIANTTGVALGSISVQGGDRGVFTALFDTTGDMGFAEMDVELGGQSAVNAGFDAVDGNATAGAIAIEAGNESAVLLLVDQVAGSASVGPVDISVGDSSTASAVFSRIGGALATSSVTLAGGDASKLGLLAGTDAFSMLHGVTVGDIAFDAGHAATLTAAFDGGEAAAAGLTVGTLTAQVGDSAAIGVRIDEFADVAIGDIALEAGLSSSIDVDFSSIAGALVAHNFSLAAGADSLLSLSVTGVGGDASLGDVSLAAGGNASIAAGISANGGDISIGDVAAAAGGSSDLAFIVQDAHSLQAGAISQLAGDSSTVGVTLAVDESGGNLAFGDVTISVGDEGQASFVAANTNAWVGSFSAGSIAAAAGDDSSAQVTLVHTAMLAPTVEQTGPAAGSMTVGDLTVTAGSASSISASADGYATVLYGGKADGAVALDLLVGDVAVAVGDGFVSGTLEQYAGAHLAVLGFGAEALGNVGVGNISLSGGDFAALDASVGGLVVGEDGHLGDGSIGDVSLVAGEGAQVDFDGYWGALGAASVGAFEAGRFDIALAQDARLSVDVLHGAPEGGLGALGDFSVGGLQAVLGDNAQVRVGFEEYADHSGTGAGEGDYSIGDIDIAVSASSTGDLSGGSLIEVDLVRHSSGLGTESGGDFTIGDVMLAAGAHGVIDLDISFTGAYERMGEVGIGTIGLAAGDDGSAAASIRVHNTVDGDIDDFALDGVEIGLGERSAAVVGISLLHGSNEGDFADIGLGDIGLDLGEDSSATVTLATSMTADAAAGNYSIGNLSVTLGSAASADLDALGIDAGEIEDVSVGNQAATLGEAASMNFVLSLASDSSIGTVTAGSVETGLGEAASSVQRIEVDASTDVGAVLFGNSSLTLDEAAEASVSLDISAGGNIGSITLGDLDARVTDGAAASLLFAATAGGNAGHMLVGDIHLSIDDAGLVTGTADTPVGGSIELELAVTGGGNTPTITTGAITLDLDGTAADDKVAVVLDADGTITVGDLIVGGEGRFSFSAADAANANTSVVLFDTTGPKVIGNVDFSGFTGSANLDLSWATGAAAITGGSGVDTIRGNAGANVIAGGEGVDAINITQGGIDTIVTRMGDSGNAAGSFDTVTGFSAGTLVSGSLSGGDRLDFGLAAGSSGNYVERAENFSTTAQFLANASDALNSGVRYFVQDNGTDTYVAVSYGSGEADVVIVLAGVADATTLQFQNFVA